MKPSAGKRILRIPYTVALEILAPVHLGPPRLTPPLPPGTAVLSVHEDYQRRTIDFIIQNEEFPFTEPGLLLPEHVASWHRPGSLLMLRKEGSPNLALDPARIAVVVRETLTELGAIVTNGMNAPFCVFEPKPGAKPMNSAELAELARHLEQFDRVMGELRHAAAAAGQKEEEKK